jgi:hypothetical protein
MAIRRGKRVTWARADRAIVAIAELIECDDFGERAREAGLGGDALRDLDRAAGVARAIRDLCRKR